MLICIVYDFLENYRQISKISNHFVVSHNFSPVTHLSNAHGRPQSRLNLPQMHHPRNTNHLQHPIPMIRLRELILFFRPPGISTRTPTTKQSPPSQPPTKTLTPHLKIFKIIMPSTCGNSTSFPSTSRRTSLCRSLHIFGPTILRRPIFT